MKKRTVVIGVLVSVIPMAQPMIIGMGIAFTSAAVILSVPQKAQAESIQIYIERAVEKKKSGDHSGAISDLNKAIAIDPESPRIYNMRAIHKRELGDISGAISDLNKAIGLNSEYYSSFLLRGIFNYEIGDKKGACSDWRKASYLGNENLSEDYAAKYVINHC